mgnify:CR=1 FL=1
MSKESINKELYSNLREALNKVVSGYILDLDEATNTVLYEQWNWDEETDRSTYLEFRSSYTYDGAVAVLTGEPERVVIKKVVEVVVETDEGVIAKALKAMTLAVTNLTNHALPTQREAAPVESIPVIKQLNDEEMIAIEPLYIHAGEIDGHGDAYVAPEEVYKMVDSFNQAIADGNLKANFDRGEFCVDFEATKAWVNEVDCYIGDTLVPEGQPLVKTLFKDPVKWQERKDGIIKGVSIQATAVIIEVEDE